MDSTAKEEAAARNAKPITPSAGDDVDLISGLDDDVLLRVLGLMRDASDAVRTGALSRRWLGLWTRVPALRFAAQPGLGAAGGGGGSPGEQHAALERYAAVVDGVLAQRAQSGCAIENLSILYTTGSDILEQPTPPEFVVRVRLLCLRDVTQFDIDMQQRLIMQQMMPACVHAVQGWIRDAFRHGVKSFNLDLRLPPLLLKFWREYGYDEDEEVVLLDGLPTPAKLQTLRLALSGTSLRLPSTLTFASLTDLSLERITIAGGGAHLLGRLVSSATCPHLQKLWMRKIHYKSSNEEMRIEANVLLELLMENVTKLVSLKLRTPSLRVFHMYKCPHEMITISAPKLEELAISFLPGHPPRCLEIQCDLLCVRSLKICLWSHFLGGTTSKYEAENDTYILLLRHCGSLTCLDVTLQCHGDKVDMIQSRVPELPHITSLTLTVNFWYPLKFGADVASLLTRFSNLRNLSLHLPLPIVRLDCNMHARSVVRCNHLDQWKSKDISMAYLLELELTGFTGTNCELWLMKSVLRTAKRVRKVAISFNKSHRQHQGRMDEFERMLLDAGMWASHRDEYMLTCIR